MDNVRKKKRKSTRNNYGRQPQRHGYSGHGYYYSERKNPNTGVVPKRMSIYEHDENGNENEKATVMLDESKTSISMPHQDKLLIKL